MKVEPNDMVIGQEYHYCELNIPQVVVDISIWETQEERDLHAKKLVDKYNVVYNGKKIEEKVGMNRGNCVSSFLGKWRIMRVENSHEESSKVSKTIQQNLLSLKT